jgi:hypothetical protein
MLTAPLIIQRDSNDEAQEPAAKRHKPSEADAASVAKAHARAKAFLEDFKALDLQSMSEEEAQQKTREMYQQLQKEADSFPQLQQLLASVG